MIRPAYSTLSLIERPTTLLIAAIPASSAVSNWGKLLGDLEFSFLGAACGTSVPGLCNMRGPGIVGWLQPAYPLARVIAFGIRALRLPAQVSQRAPGSAL